MDKLVISGPTKLKGEVTISGAKNAAVAILPATLLVNGICKIENLPNISDVKMSCKILAELGAKITWLSENEIEIDTRDICCTQAPIDMTSKFRASYYLLGALLSRCGHAEVGLPGGCNLGARPIDQHIKAFEALGAKVVVAQGKVTAKAKKMVGTSIYMDVVSVGATINAMLASVLAEGTTTIDNAAKEPHIVDVANFLNTMGADIRGAGTDVIKINGVKELKGTEHDVIPDRIEAATYMVAAAMTKGDITVENVLIEHLKPVTAKLIEAGCEVIEMDNSIRVIGPEKLKAVDVKTLPHPGFPTDVQAQFMAMLTVARGTGVVIETVFENRFMHVAEFNRMGADIKIEGRTAVVKGVDQLYGANVNATDLRAGAALILCGLIAEGETQIGKIYHIQRGYVDIDKKIRSLGGNIEIVEC